MANTKAFLKKLQLSVKLLAFTLKIFHFTFTGFPAYWSGYFSTRPFMKKLSREVATNLRASEILFTWAYNLAMRVDNKAMVNTFEANYANLVKARTNLGLFQHHDAITGTAKQFVTHDYGQKLFEALKFSRHLLKSSAQFVLLQDRSTFHRKILESDFERPTYETRAKPLALDLKNGAQHIVVVNSLGQDSDEIVTFFLDGIKSRGQVCVFDENGRRLGIQFSPTWTTEGFVRLEKYFSEVSFLTRLPALSVTKFTVQLCSEK